MRITIISILFVVLLGACGEGKWGGELHLSVGGTDAQGESLAPGHTLTQTDGAWSLTLDRACLAVELALITPADAAGETGSDCFCHGDPPVCHGDCSVESAGSGSADLVAELDTVVDLLAGPTPILSRGAAPGDYTSLALVLGGEHGASDPPAGCPDMEGRTLWVRGTLTDLTTSQTWTLTVDLRAEIVTAPISATPQATATTDSPATLTTGIRLDLALDHVDFAAVTANATDTVTIGGDPGQNPDAAHEILHVLSHAESYTVQGQQEN